MKPSSDTGVGSALSDLVRYQNEASSEYARRLGVEPVYTPVTGFDDEMIGTGIAAVNIARLTPAMEKKPLAILYNPSVARTSNRNKKRIAYHEPVHNYTDGIECVEASFFGHRIPLGKDLEEGLAERMTEKVLGYLDGTSYRRGYELARRLDEVYGVENFIRDYRKKGISVLKDKRVKKAILETYLPLVLQNPVS